MTTPAQPAARPAAAPKVNLLGLEKAAYKGAPYLVGNFLVEF